MQMENYLNFPKFNLSKSFIEHGLNIQEIQLKWRIFLFFFFFKYVIVRSKNGFFIN